MTEKNEVQVIIDGKVLTMSGFESNEYLQKLANYINDMIVEYNKIDSFKHSGKDIQHRLIEINIADEYFKARDKAARLGEEIKINGKGTYCLNITLKSDASELSQTSMSLSANNMLIRTLTVQGTGGQWIEKKVEFEVFVSIDNYIDIAFAQTGIDIERITVTKIQ